MLPRITLNSLAQLPGFALALVQLVIVAAEQVLEVAPFLALKEKPNEQGHRMNSK